MNKKSTFLNKITLFFIFSCLLVFNSAAANAGQWIQNTDDPWAGFDGNLNSITLSTDTRPVVADLNEDGNSDMIIGSYFGGVAIFYGDGTGSYTQDTTSEVATFSFITVTTPCVGDLSGDGHLDILVGQLNGEVYYFTGDGTGNFTEITSGVLAGLDVGTYAEPFVADINGDTKNDLIVGNNDGTLVLYTADGAGSFVHDTATLAAIDVGTDSVPFLASLDAATGIDLLVGGADGKINPYSNNGTGGFIAATTSTLYGLDVGTTAVPFIGDINLDTNNDVLIGSYSGKINFYEGDGTGSFIDKTSSSGLSAISRGADSRPFAADVDGDTDLDIIVGNNMGTITVALNDGSGNFSIDPYTGFEPPHEDRDSRPVLADINSDGNIDMLIGTAWGNLYLYVGDGSGSFTADTETNLSTIDVGSIAVPLVADFNDDDHIDILVAAADGYLYLYYGDGANTFTLDTIGSLSGIDTGTNPAPCVTYVNDDDYLDIVIGNSFGELWVFLSDGAGNYARDTLSTLASVDVGSTAKPVIGDVNGDGHPDIIIGNNNGNLWIYNGDGSGNFVQDTSSFLTTIDVGYQASPRVGDINHDGYQDIIITNFTGDAIIYLGDETANYTLNNSLESYHFGITSYSSIEDTDGDCDNDIVIGTDNGRVYLFAYDSDDDDNAIDHYDAYVWYADADGDGFGDPAVSTYACSQPEGYVADNTDCNDSASAAYPGGTEICDTLDNDCDSQTDEDDAVDAPTWYRDSDADMFGDALTHITSCYAVPGYVSDNTDCDDTNGAVSPAINEICDGIDNDCDEQIDEEGAIGGQTWYADSDGDNYGNNGVSIIACDAPENYVSDNTDCDDTNGAINPLATEICDGIDNNCSLIIDDVSPILMPTWYRDADSDGYGGVDFMAACTQPAGYVSTNTDCNDADADIHPNAAEICGDDIDNNCDDITDETTIWFADTDSDGFGDPAVTQESCDTPTGYVADNTDCNDSQSTANPEATELCTDAIDNDCDGVVNEGCSVIDDDDDTDDDTDTDDDSDTDTTVTDDDDDDTSTTTTTPTGDDSSNPSESGGTDDTADTKGNQASSGGGCSLNTLNQANPNRAALFLFLVPLFLTVLRRREKCME